MSVTLKGVLGPVVTTFQTSGGDVDTEAFASNVRAHLDGGHARHRRHRLHR